MSANDATESEPERTPTAEDLAERRKESSRAAGRRWYHKNKAKRAISQKAWEEANKEVRAAYFAEWEKANKEKRSAQHKASYEADKEAISARTRDRYHANHDQQRQKSRAYYLANRDACRARNKARYEANRDAEAARKKVRYYESKYGLATDDVARMIKAQGNRCLCCKTLFGLMRAHQPRVDHCHKTGRVRGILCDHCNMVLGNVHDNPELLRALARYLEQSQKDQTQDDSGPVVRLRKRVAKVAR